MKVSIAAIASLETILFCTIGQGAAALTFNENAFNTLVAKIESDAHDLAAEVEHLYTNNRCSQAALNACAHGNYDTCGSDFPNPMCLATPEYFDDGCNSDGEGNQRHPVTCSAVVDFSVSAVNVYGIPQGKITTEGVCWHLELDSWFQDRYAQDTSYWASLGVAPPSMHFGSTQGVFRSYPARRSWECIFFDPRKQPWYVAASGGPKNVLIILDTSEAMGYRLGWAKAAARQIVESLTVSDRVAMVPFAEEASLAYAHIGNFIHATHKRKTWLNYIANKIESSGSSSNFGAAFQAAFSIFEDSIENEEHVDGNSAILFITASERTAGPELSEVTTLVTDGMSRISAKLGKKPLLFTYSIGESDSPVHTYPAELACAVETGVWTKIVEYDFAEKISSYHELFALGTGADENANRNFTAWVEPSDFGSGGAHRRTTVSVPVYDRSSTPHVFLGAVGVDLNLQAMDNALGSGENASAISLGRLLAESNDRVVRASETSSPASFNLTPCEIQAWRQASEGMVDDSLCAPDCTGVTNAVEIQHGVCGGALGYPDQLYQNLGVRYSTALFTDHVCCAINANDTELCRAGSSAAFDTFPWLFLTIPAFCIGVPLLGYGCFVCMDSTDQCCKASSSDAPTTPQVAANEGASRTEPVIEDEDDNLKDEN